MKVFGVTGTNGKSSVTNIIQDVYSHFHPCGYIGTISIRYGNVTLPPNLTTPDPIILHHAMHDMVENGMEAVALEVSSHGLELGRVQSVDLILQSLQILHMIIWIFMEHLKIILKQRKNYLQI